MRKIPYRTMLPLIAGLIAIGLMAWGVQVNYRCRFYDAFRPFWPCEAPHTILGWLNAPAFVPAFPILHFWQTAPHYFEDALKLPLIVLWWWFVGTRLDFGILGTGTYRRRWFWVISFTAAIAMLLGLFGWAIQEEIAFHQKVPQYAGFGTLYLIGGLRALPIYLWLIALTIPLGIAVFRIAKGKTGRTDVKLASGKTKIVVACVLVLYCICAAGFIWHVKKAEEQILAEFERKSIIVKGRVVDERGLPVYAVGVSLVPLLDKPEFQDARSVTDFTDENGEYTLRPLEAGRNFLSVLWKAPPSARLPFLSTYYPGVAEERQAQIFDLAPAQHLNLNPIRLSRVNLVKVHASISWSNGSPEPDGYLLFVNMDVKNHGVIGNESIHPDADGMVSLPVGFDYRATAQIECDGGERIKSAYTSGQTVSTKPSGKPMQPLSFVFPGQPCKAWHPK